MKRRNCWSIYALSAPLLLTGCSLVPMKRRLPVPRPPAQTLTATPQELVARIDQRWNDFENLTATVDIHLTLLKPQQGLATDWPDCRGWIVMQKPEYLRVVGQYLGARAFNMASDGKTFTILIPLRNKAFTGPTTVTKRSENQLENIRPGFFFEAMMVRGLDPEDYYARISDTETIEDAAKKHLYTMPEYVLSITKHGSDGSRLDKPVRVITFHRDDLLPSNQDLYDAEGNLESQVSYSVYRDFGGTQYPTKVVIRRPLEGLVISLTVEKVVKNQKLPEGEFNVEIPPGTQVKHLE
jgi:hypothetical protein